MQTFVVSATPSFFLVIRPSRRRNANGAAKGEALQTASPWRHGPCSCAYGALFTRRRGRGWPNGNRLRGRSPRVQRSGGPLDGDPEASRRGVGPPARLRPVEGGGGRRRSDGPPRSPPQSPTGARNSLRVRRRQRARARHRPSLRRRPSPPPATKAKAESALAQIGRATMSVFVEGQLVLAFFGQILVAAAATLRAPRTGNWKNVLPTMERVGADAVPIVLLINFLVGFVMAFQGAVQLKQFGANIFVADLVGLSVTRELGPLMTAIILSGRSGASFAAELGTMKVSEEVDALRTMGFAPIRFLVFPRIAALFLVMPVLSL